MESKPDQDEIDSSWEDEGSLDSGWEEDEAAIDSGWEGLATSADDSGAPQRALTAEERETRAARAAARKDRQRAKAAEKSERRKTRTAAASAKQKKQERQSRQEKRPAVTPRATATERGARRREGRSGVAPETASSAAPDLRMAPAETAPARALRRATPLVVVVVLVLAAATGVLGLLLARR